MWYNALQTTDYSICATPILFAHVVETFLKVANCTATKTAFMFLLEAIELTVESFSQMILVYSFFDILITSDLTWDMVVTSLSPTKVFMVQFLLLIPLTKSTAMLDFMALAFTVQFWRQSWTFRILSISLAAGLILHVLDLIP